MAREDKLRRLSVCFSEKQSVWISKSKSYDLQVFNKSNYQSKPHA
jgi:hypothetical protein